MDLRKAICLAAGVSGTLFLSLGLVRIYTPNLITYKAKKALVKDVQTICVVDKKALRKDERSICVEEKALVEDEQSIWAEEKALVKDEQTTSVSDNKALLKDEKDVCINVDDVTMQLYVRQELLTGHFLIKTGDVTQGAKHMANVITVSQDPLIVLTVVKELVPEYVFPALLKQN